jgi:hypothetical protein
MENVNKEKSVDIARDQTDAEDTVPALQPEIDWPDFYAEAIETVGKPLSEIISEDREDRF